MSSSRTRTIASTSQSAWTTSTSMPSTPPALVPISAHALFARPVVVSPDSKLAIEVVPDGQAHGVVWCDGRRASELPPGARTEVRRGTIPVLLARLQQRPFTDRLVRKFDLPVSGWRGAAEQRRQQKDG